MIDDIKAARWAKDAAIALVRHLDKDEEISRLSSIILALLADREERERYIREQP
jgi:hypothetical protein